MTEDDLTTPQKGRTTFSLDEKSIVDGMFELGILDEVEDLVQQAGIGYLEAITHLIEQRKLEPEQVASQIKQKGASAKEFKKKLFAEAKSLRLIKQD
jgi:ketol-acid reductoisomerase